VSNEEIRDIIITVFEKAETELPLQFRFIQSEVEHKMQIKDQTVKLHPQILVRILEKMVKDETLQKYPKGYILAPKRSLDDVDKISTVVHDSYNRTFSIIENNTGQSVLTPCHDQITNMLEREKSLRHSSITDKDPRIVNIIESIWRGNVQVYDMVQKKDQELSIKLRQMVDHSINKEYLSPPYTCP
jgi:hypothetical protein